MMSILEQDEGAGRGELTFAVVRGRGQGSSSHEPLQAAHDCSPRAAAVTGGRL